MIDDKLEIESFDNLYDFLDFIGIDYNEAVDMLVRKSKEKMKYYISEVDGETWIVIAKVSK